MSFNDIESLLRSRLGAGSSRPLPSPGFEERLRGSLTPRVAESHRRRHAVEGLIGLAAIVALVAVAGPWLLAPRSGDVGPSGSRTTAPSGGTSSVPLAHAQKWFLAFDYPAAWKLADENVVSMADPNPLVHLTFVGSDWVTTARSVGFVGSGSATDECVSQDPTQAVEVVCTTKWTLPEGSVEVRFFVASVAEWNGLSAIDGLTLPGYTQTTIDGMPALFQKTTNVITNASTLTRSIQVVPDADEVLSWLLPTQHALDAVYEVDAAIRGPNDSELDAQVRAMMASLRWEPANNLPTDPAALQAAGTKAAKTALTWLRTSIMGKVWQYSGTHLFDCFPDVPGESAAATITSSQQHPLKKPLRVTCTTEIAPNAMHGWTLSLTHSWAAGPSYAAGRSTGLFDLAPDGTVEEMDQQKEGWTYDVYPYQGSNGPG